MANARTDNPPVPRQSTPTYPLDFTGHFSYPSTPAISAPQVVYSHGVLVGAPPPPSTDDEDRETLDSYITLAALAAPNTVSFSSIGSTTPPLSLLSSNRHPPSYHRPQSPSAAASSQSFSTPPLSNNTSLPNEDIMERGVSPSLSMDSTLVDEGPGSTPEPFLSSASASPQPRGRQLHDPSIPSLSSPGGRNTTAAQTRPTLFSSGSRGHTPISSHAYTPGLLPSALEEIAVLVSSPAPSRETERMSMLTRAATLPLTPSPASTELLTSPSSKRRREDDPESTTPSTSFTTLPALHDTPPVFQQGHDEDTADVEPPPSYSWTLPPHDNIHEDVFYTPGDKARDSLGLSTAPDAPSQPLVLSDSETELTPRSVSSSPTPESSASSVLGESSAIPQSDKTSQSINMVDPGPEASALSLPPLTIITRPRSHSSILKHSPPSSPPSSASSSSGKAKKNVSFLLRMLDSTSEEATSFEKRMGVLGLKGDVQDTEGITGDDLLNERLREMGVVPSNESSDSGPDHAVEPITETTASVPSIPIIPEEVSEDPTSPELRLFGGVENVRVLKPIDLSLPPSPVVSLRQMTFNVEEFDMRNPLAVSPPQLPRELQITTEQLLEMAQIRTPDPTETEFIAALPNLITTTSAQLYQLVSILIAGFALPILRGFAGQSVAKGTHLIAVVWFAPVFSLLKSLGFEDEVDGFVRWVDSVAHEMGGVVAGAGYAASRANGVNI